MTMALLEAAVNAMHSYLSANMVAKVAALNTRYADTIVLEDIKGWYKGNVPQAEPEYPTVAIVGSGLTPKLQRAVSLHISNEISLIVFVGDEHVEDRFYRLCRYALGLMELCVAGEKTMGYRMLFSGRITVTETLETPPFLQGMIIPVTLEKIEEF